MTEKNLDNTVKGVVSPETKQEVEHIQRKRFKKDTLVDQDYISGVRESPSKEHGPKVHRLTETPCRDTNPKAEKEKHEPRVKRKRGRPKGSKNKKKRLNFPDASNTERNTRAVTISGQNTLVGDEHVSRAPELPSEGRKAKAQSLNESRQRDLKPNAEKNAQETRGKRKRGRPKGSKNKKNHKNIRVVALGSGQEVGRSCILLTVNKFNILLDCGMHPGYSKLSEKFPRFSRLHELTKSKGEKTLTEVLLVFKIARQPEIGAHSLTRLEHCPMRFSSQTRSIRNTDLCST